MSLDLHLHSTVSDGRLAPGELVRYAHSCGVTVMALSDHDATDGVDAATRLGASLGMRVIPAIVEEQRAAAAEVGCAFFDTYRAMGGARSMPTWVRRGLGQADMTHPTAIGSEVIGNWVFRALMQGYNAYLKSSAAH